MDISSDNRQALSAFAEPAADFCAFIDSLQNEKPNHLYTSLELLLARLMASILPVRSELGPEDKGEFDKLRMTHQDWKQIVDVVGEAMSAELRALFELQGGYDVYKPGADASDQYEARRAEMLWDDLADIYRDLRYGLDLWQLGKAESMAEAAWQWRWGYENHWGQHLLRAMMTVHEIRYLLFAE
jgi:hypothetical protein